MKKRIALLLAVLCGATLLITFPQIAFSQTSNLKVVSYSWYTSQYTGDFIVVGEIQNTGPDTFVSASMTGTVYTTDNQAQTFDPAYSQIYVSKALLPNQKAPFYLEYTPEKSVSGNFSWVSLGIDRVEFNLFGTTNNTAPLPYSDLQIIAKTNFIQSNNYTVTGVLRNTGNLYPENVWVVATFYDLSGKVVAAGFSNFVSPHFLPPNATAGFTLSPYDATSQMATVIASYSLQTLSSGSTPTQPTASPSPSSSASSSPSTSTGTSSSPSSSTSTSTAGEPSVPLNTVYAIIAAFVIAVVVIVLALFLRKKPKNNSK